MVSRDKWSNNKYANRIPEKKRNHRSFDTTRNLHQRSLHKKTTSDGSIFDLEKAYDTTWKYGILRDLYNLGLRGRLPMFIKNLLFERTFRVRVGSTLSNSKHQEEGVPQGSILSVTLFSIKIKNIVKCLTPSIDCALNVDDFVICHRASHMNIVERQLQLNLNKVNKWARENGFKFSKSKTKCVHFCSLRKMHNDPLLKIDDSEIPVVNKYKFLGIIFDKKLSFIPRIKYLKNKSTRAQQLLRVVAHTEWGADRQTLIKLYRTLLRSQLDYGIFVYRSARKSYLKQLDHIHHGSLRLVLGAFRTPPINSSYTEAHEAPLQIRSEKLALQYYTKLKSSPSNPAYNCTFDPKYRQYFDQKEKSIRPFGLRMEPILKEATIPLDNIHKSILLQIPPWIIKNPKVNLQLNQLHKTKSHPFTYQEKH